ncbi:ty1-copia retrotransposon protein [Tanacetum coccineum]|uniref:Ty1-copia retrotransposon protein n=1 Tax=Tanacetum coccineum TaxID=301880 RepID=A0ABQ5DKU7_9ASTR
MVSGSLLVRAGLKVTLKGDKVIITQNNDFVGKCYVTGGLFVLNTESSTNESSASAYIVESANMWHGRLGHLNIASIKKLKTMNLINVVDAKEFSKCPICVEAKHAKKSFKNVAYKSTQLLELIHSDLADFKNTMSKGGKKYYITFVDDYSRYTKVYLIRSKDEAEEMFLKFKAEAENQLDRRIKRLRDAEFFETKFPLKKNDISAIGSLSNSIASTSSSVHACSTNLNNQENDTELVDEFDMKDLGEVDVILRIKVRKTENGYSLCQSHYIEKVLKRFDYFDVDPVKTPYDSSKCLKKNKVETGVFNNLEYAKILGPRSGKTKESLSRHYLYGIAHCASILNIVIQRQLLGLLKIVFVQWKKRDTFGFRHGHWQATTGKMDRGGMGLKPMNGDHMVGHMYKQLKIDYVLSQNAPENEATPEISIIPRIRSSQNEIVEVKRKFEKDNRTARGHLLNHMSNFLFDLFINQKSAKVIWETLKKKYGADDAGKKKYIVGNWLRYQMVDDKHIMEQVHVYKNLVTEVLNEGMNIHMRTEEANHLKDKQISVSSSFVKANLVEPTGTSKNRNKGHKAYQCKDRKYQQNQNQRLVAPQANLVENEIIAAVVVETNPVEDKSAWIMDSGASRHLCNNKRLFHQFEEVADGGQFYMGNNGIARVISKGKVFLKFTSGKTLALNNVLYVPSLQRNMVSGSLLVRAGLESFRFRSDKVQFRRTSLTGFPAQSVRSSNVIALDSPYLLVLITETSQSRQHVNTILIHLESRKSPTAELFDFDLGRVSIHHCWSGLPPFQYQRSWSKKADRSVLISVALPDFRKPNVGPKTFDCVFIGYAVDSAPYRFMFLDDNSICESRYAEFFETFFPLKKNDISDTGSLSNATASTTSSCVHACSSNLNNQENELRRSKRKIVESSFGPDFITAFLVENDNLDKVNNNIVLVFLLEEDPKTYKESITSIDASFRKEAIKSKLDSIMVIGSDCVIICLYVDDILILGTNISVVNKTKSFLSSQFDMKDLGEVDVILGIKVRKTENGYSLYTHNPNNEHWDALYHLLQYLKGTLNWCLHFNKIPAILEGYCDANWVSDKDETCIARFTMEAEFIALELAGQEAEWLKNLLADIPILKKQFVLVSIHYDSQASIRIAKNSVYNGKKRHIRIRHGIVKQLLKME